MSNYYPEGRLQDSCENQKYLGSYQGLQDAMIQGKVLEARAAVCDAGHDLLVDLGFCQGVIHHREGAIGMEDGSTRDIAIISRVNKPVSFLVTGFEVDSTGMVRPVLSRRQDQLRCREEYLDRLQPGDIIDARVTHLEPFGCFVDIGCGISSLIPIDAISVSRITHPSDRFRVGMDIRAVVRGRDELGRITLSHKELLGSWEQNAARFQAGETVSGVIRSVEEYGVFVELAPNLAGLAEPRPDARPGQQASVYIKSLIPERMKVKLIIIDSFDAPASAGPEPLTYYVQERHISRWDYSPEGCRKQVFTDFTANAADGDPDGMGPK